jgi:hypothetical protein
VPVEVTKNQPLTIKSPPLSDHKKTNFFGFGPIEVELEEVQYFDQYCCMRVGVW